MSRLDDVIQEVRNSRTGSRAWIYDADGNLSSDAVVGDVMPLLEELKDVEIDISDYELEEFLDDPHTEGDNTYNWGANISNHLNLNWGRNDDGEYITAIRVHLGGDVRGNYSDYFVISGDISTLYECDSVYQSMPLNEEYEACIDLFNEGIDVYRRDTGEEIGTFYEDDRKSLIREVDDEDNM